MTKYTTISKLLEDFKDERVEQIIFECDNHMVIAKRSSNGINLEVRVNKNGK